MENEFKDLEITYGNSDHRCGGQWFYVGDHIKIEFNYGDDRGRYEKIAEHVRDSLQKYNELKEENESLKSIHSYIKLLENESFEGWSEESKLGYLTACMSIRDKFVTLENTNK